MAGFKFDFFKGTRPRITATKLRVGEAQTAENVILGTGDLEPIVDKSTSQALSIEAGTIYRYKDDAGDLWFEWIATVEVAQGPIKNDSYNRVYYTGALSGDGKPKFTTNTMADLGTGAPYPNDWLYMGIPAPGAKCTASVTTLPEDKDSGTRQVSLFQPEKFIIDQVLYTVHPGTGTDAQAWDLSSDSTDGIYFDVQAGSAFEVTEIINNNTVKIKSATEPGITARTRDSDTTTDNSWAPMDETGSTKEANFIGWRIPPECQVKIEDHGLGVGDVVVCSRVNFALHYFPSLTDVHYEQDWPSDASYYEGGTTKVEVQDAVISPAATLDGTKFLMLGSFYYDVDRASSLVSELEDRTYVYTYVNAFGEEGPPSPPSDVQPQLDGRDVAITGMSLPPTIGYNITKMRLYRSNSTEAGTEYQFVKEFDLAREITDDVLSEDLGEVIPSTTWDPPPATMRGITDMPNGMMVGYSGKTVHFAEPYFPHAWPADYDQAIAYDIVGMAAFGTSVAVMTTGWPYVITGTHSRNASVRPIKVNYACVSTKSIATGDDAVYYASKDGLVKIDANGARLVTETYVDKSNWSAYSPSTMVGAYYDGKYHGFWGFDTTAVEDEIVAEVSGTITDADEEDIRSGGKTVILTLTNDNWVAAGTSFNNQRQNIIDGITSSSAQTNGWNNIVRDTALSVTDVVRTSDTVVTITLPTAATYGIDSAETQTVTIPAAALQNSNDAVVCGSTFKIEWKRTGTTLTIGGSIDGALEAEIVTGGETVTLTLTNDEWISVADGFNDYRDEITLGLISNLNEDGGWNDEVPQLIPVASVVRTSNSVVTITLPAVAAYSVTLSESVTATVPHEVLATQTVEDVTSSNSAGIVATGVPSALFSGTATASMTENEIIAGGKVLDITLTNDTWIAAGTGPIGTTAQSEAILAAITASTSQTNGWNAEVRDNFVVGDLTRVSSTVARVTLGAETSYGIDDNETISMTIDSSWIAGGDDIIVSNTFGVTAQNPITATLGGTITASVEEDAIIAGGKTITLTLSNDTWLASGASFNAQRANIIAGLDSAQSEANGWNNVLRDAGIDVDDVVRTSDTVVTITLDAEASYNITAQETITATIPASAMSISALAVTASPTFTISVDVPATIAVTGTADGATDDDIVNGGKTIILTVADDTWVSSGAAFNAQRQNIIDGLDAATSPATGWNNVIRDAIDVSTCVRTSDTVVTITLPAAATYDADADEEITVTVPATALTQSLVNVAGDVTIDILDIFDTFLMAGCQGEKNAPTRKAEVLTVEDSFTNWSEITVDEDSSVTHQWHGFGIEYNADDSLWIAIFRDPTTNYKDSIWTSADDGASWTNRFISSYTASAIGLYGWVFWHPDADIAFAGCRGNAETYDFIYSTDGGLNWTNTLTPYSASSSPTVLDGEPVYYHGAARAISSGYSVWNGSGYDFHYMYSPDLTTKSNVDTAWTEATLSFSSYTDAITVSVAPGGDGYSYFIGVNRGDQVLRISRVAHNGTTESFIGNASDIEAGNYNEFYFASSPTKIVGLNDDGYLIKCASSGAATFSNWVYPTDTSVGNTRIATGVSWEDIIYDPGAPGKTGLGFVAIGTKASDQKGVIYTSSDGDTWTLRYTTTFDITTFYAAINRVASKYQQAYA
jgi:hypothetical protein